MHLLLESQSQETPLKNHKAMEHYAPKFDGIYQEREGVSHGYNCLKQDICSLFLWN